ncbi:hypothetical protein [Marinicrinis sediminis]|uniref:Uncharacterized protein n=1 Tax=Marinicrinis sediminis TaxID=1652465 RepID=A0ABW5R5W3_9BACL
MNSKDFYRVLLQDSGVNAHSYKTISQNILENHTLSEYEKMQELQAMNEIFQQMSDEDQHTLLN